MLLVVAAELLVIFAVARATGSANRLLAMPIAEVRLDGPLRRRILEREVAVVEWACAAGLDVGGVRLSELPRHLEPNAPIDVAVDGDFEPLAEATVAIALVLGRVEEAVEDAGVAARLGTQHGKAGGVEMLCDYPDGYDVGAAGGTWQRRRCRCTSL